MHLSGASLQGPVCFLLGTGVQSHILGFSTDTALQLGEKWNHYYYSFFIYIYILFVEHMQEVKVTIKSWCPTLTPAWSASEPEWTADTKMPLSFPPIRVISDRRFSPERERLCTGRNEFRWGPEVNDGRNGLEKKAQIKEKLIISMYSNVKWGRTEMTETDKDFFLKVTKKEFAAVFKEWL